MLRRTDLGRAAGEIAHLLLEAHEVGILAERARAHRRADAFGLRGSAVGAGEGHRVRRRMAWER